MAAILFAGMTFLSGPFGIDIGYYLHLGGGQWRMIWDQVPVKELIADEQADAFVRDRLKLAERVRNFAIDQLGLEGSDNYTTYYDTGDRPVVWALTASPYNSLEPYRWSYPVIGSAPYRGFFDRHRAEREEARFRERGYDTYLRGVGAYSTLGWFRDPLLSSMLRYPAIDLADVLIHELLHATIWIEGDADFNERLATFVGREGAKLWALTEWDAGADSLASRAAAGADRALYHKLFRELAGTLDSLYATNAPESAIREQKQDLIEQTRNKARTTKWHTSAYSEVDSWVLNNARLSLFRTYNEPTDLFDRVLDKAGGLPAAIRVFDGCEDQRDPKAYLEAWLERPETSK